MKITILLMLIVLCGCIIMEYEVEPAEIVSFAREKQNEGAVQNLLWYRGREGNFDHFKYVHGLFAERRFKVEAGAIPIPNNLALTDNAARWIAIPSIGNEWKFYVPQQ